MVLHGETQNTALRQKHKKEQKKKKKKIFKHKKRKNVAFIGVFKVPCTPALSYSLDQGSLCDEVELT